MSLPRKYRGRDVADIIVDGKKVSIRLGICAAAIATVVGIVLGAVAALRRNKLVDKVIMVIRALPNACFQRMTVSGTPLALAVRM